MGQPCTICAAQLTQAQKVEELEALLEKARLDLRDEVEAHTLESLLRQERECELEAARTKVQSLLETVRAKDEARALRGEGRAAITPSPRSVSYGRAPWPPAGCQSE